MLKWGREDEHVAIQAWLPLPGWYGCTHALGTGQTMGWCSSVSLAFIVVTFCMHDNVLQVNCTKLRFHLSLQIQNICSYLRNSTFFHCHVILDPAPFIKMCEEELCKCNLTDRLDCACSAFTQYSRACARNKAPIQWRTRDICRKCLWFCIHTS